MLEEALAAKLASITAKVRQSRSQSELAVLQAEDSKEEQWLSDFRKREEIAAKEVLAGRTSGTKEWRAQRSELGDFTKASLPTLKGGMFFVPGDPAGFKRLTLILLSHKEGRKSY